MAVLTFQSFYRSKCWGGSRLGSTLKRALPADAGTVGESWELADRAGAVSELAEACEGCRDLHALWQKDRVKFFGRRAPQTERFPLLVKLLDVAEKERLSIQVHPGPQHADALGGETKRELWYFLECDPQAKLYAGWRRGGTREDIEKNFGTGTLPLLMEQFPAEAGEAFYNPPGRVHALEGGALVLEIQESSETTYRIYDWEGHGAQGKPRELHLEAARACANFADIAPTWMQPHGERLLDCGAFAAWRSFLFEGEARAWAPQGETFYYHFVVDGAVALEGRTFERGQGFLVTADHAAYELVPVGEGAEVVTVGWGNK